MVRRLLGKVVADQLDSPLELSKDDIAMEKTIRGKYDVIFAGHTHHRRLARRAKNDGVHVNTGSWADRMTLLRGDIHDARRFNDIYRALIESDRDELTSNQLGLVRRECPVAVMGDLKASGCPGLNVAIGFVPARQTADFQIEFNEPLN